MDHALSETSIDGFPATVLGAPGAGVEVAFAPGTGMVGCSLRHRGEELLGQLGGLPAYARSGSSFGIPLLHPWANRLAEPRYRAGDDVVEVDPERSPLHYDENGLPIHGLLTASPHWEQVETGADARGARLLACLDFGAHPELLAAFPFPHELRLEAQLAAEADPGGSATARGAALDVQIELRPTGVVPVPISFGFHPYLRLPGVPREEWLVHMPVRRRGLLDERGIPTGETEPPPFTSGALAERALDDLFPELDQPARFELSGGGRRIAVELLDGYPVAQVFSPAGADFICFEPMTAPTNALVTRDGLRHVEPGGRFEASFRIVIEDA